MNKQFTQGIGTDQETYLLWASFTPGPAVSVFFFFSHLIFIIKLLLIYFHERRVKEQGR